MPTGTISKERQIINAKWYVYELSDPTTGRVFYVGKGCGDRMYQHGNTDACNFRKQQKIKSIGYNNIVIGINSIKKINSNN